MANKKDWYYSTSIDFFQSFFSVKEGDRVSLPDAISVYGPFRNFTAAKKDALEYHRCTIGYAQACITTIKNYKTKCV